MLRHLELFLVLRTPILISKQKKRPDARKPERTFLHFFFLPAAPCPPGAPRFLPCACACANASP